MRFYSTADGQIIYGSSMLVYRLGYTFQEFLEATTADFIHTEDVPAFVENTKKLIQYPGKSIDYRYRLQHKNGETILCEGTITNMLHEPGINALVSNFKDISEENKFANKHYKSNYH